jgi:hypothetical protein
MFVERDKRPPHFGQLNPPKRVVRTKLVGSGLGMHSGGNDCMCGTTKPPSLRFDISGRDTPKHRTHLLSKSCNRL